MRAKAAGSFALRFIVWAALITSIGVALMLAAMSPYLAWRDPYYITAGFAGIIGLGLLLVQPMLIGGYLSGLRAPFARRIHRLVGLILVMAVIVHVGGLWITSPPDVIDALTFTSPTPFSDWGVIAMWALFTTALLATFRKRLKIGLRSWGVIHRLLGVVIILCTVVHAVLIEGTMETISKVALCVLVISFTIPVVFGKRFWAGLRLWGKRP